MRWNCPHCEEIVTAGIDFENTTKAYVRCGKCKGMALIHRSAVLADYVKARRLEEEAQLESEIHLTQAAAATTRMRAMEKEIKTLQTVTPPPPNAQMAMQMSMSADGPTLGGGVTETRSTSPSTFQPSFEAVEEPTAPTVATATFSYTVPPAFLISDRPAAAERAFATEPDPGETTVDIPVATKTTTTNRSTIALLIAAAIAIASGTYLYTEGKKAFTPSTTTPVRADVIQSKANSAARVENLVIVRVPSAILREAPTIEAKALQSVERSTAMKIIEEKSGWLRITNPKVSSADQTAWIRADLVTRVPN